MEHGLHSVGKGESMTKMKFAVPGMILGLGLIASTVSYGKPEDTKKTKKACVYCHVTAKSKELNDTGKCYLKNSKSLEGCPTPAK
jgi:hypothetical protein